ncbi:MAG: GNAT family N-acetyltransferase [Thermostichales cyanobacterium BF4_bins_65]
MSPALSLRWCHDLREVEPVAWQSLVTDRIPPFLHWHWLWALEQSHCVSHKSGWLPCHLLVRQGGSLIAALPLYLKSHSQGEFVFDQEWAAVARQVGVSYYPKLLGMAPLTPGTGYQPLIHPDADADSLWPLMLEAIDQFCRQRGIAICSLLYVDPQWHQRLQGSGFVPRITHNYQWHNPGYQTFEDYLQQFNANQRRNIKRERQSLLTAGITLTAYTGSRISHRLFDQMYEFYSRTCAQYWNWSKYLNRQFFRLLDPVFRDYVVFFAAEREEEIVGMSFCLYKGERLFGRYWGCREEVKNLHFNVCYYEPIVFAIERGVRNFDPGAGGEHKIRRGFPATPQYSFHRFYAPRLQRLILPYLEQVNPLMLAELERVNQQAVPFREDLLPSLANLTQIRSD